MLMDMQQLRTAFEDLNGRRTVRLRFDAAEDCTIQNALLVPAEEDGLIKLTDGSTEFVVDSARIAWIEIGPPALN